MTLEIHAFGLDDTIHHKISSIYIFVYRAKLHHVNTLSGITPLTCGWMTFKKTKQNKIYVRKKKKNIATFQEHIAKRI